MNKWLRQIILEVGVSELNQVVIYTLEELTTYAKECAAERDERPVIIKQAEVLIEKLKREGFGR
jgi:hypothetical protein